MSKNKKEKKKVTTRTKVTYFILFVILVITSVVYIAYSILNPNDGSGSSVVDVNTISIDGYGITCDDNDTELYKEEYEALKKNLLSNDINEDEYAQSVAKMFIIDLYTIKNKINKYDVGGVEFVYPDGLSNYKSNVMDTMYKYVEDNSKGNRAQTLPVVNAISIDSTKETTFKIGEVEYDAYKYGLSWTYTNDYGYDEEAEVIVIKDNDKMYVVEKN